MDNVLSYLAAQEKALRAGARALRAGDPEGIHDTRVGARRARSTLRTFAELFPEAERSALEASLREYAGELGHVRDLQVLREVLTKQADGDLAAWLEKAIDRDLFAGWQRLERDLSTSRHRHVQDEMAAVLLGSRSNGVNVRKRVRKAGERADKRLARAGDGIERLHDARKAAKRARYAAEAAGGPTRTVAHYERLQDLLGHHHDLVMAAQYLERVDLPSGLTDQAAALGVRLRTEAEAVRLEAIAFVP